jgi:DNA-binding MarR family transcriptional regulator
VTVSDIATHAGLAQSSASRNVAALSGRHWLKRPGLGLVQLESDPNDIRKKLVTLTPKGKKVIEQLVHTVSGGRTEDEHKG